MIPPSASSFWTPSAASREEGCRATGRGGDPDPRCGHPGHPQPPDIAGPDRPCRGGDGRQGAPSGHPEPSLGSDDFACWIGAPRPSGRPDPGGLPRIPQIPNSSPGLPCGGKIIFVDECLKTAAPVLVRFVPGLSPARPTPELRPNQPIAPRRRRAESNRDRRLRIWRRRFSVTQDF